jgi:hypothetical protein
MIVLQYVPGSRKNGGSCKPVKFRNVDGENEQFLATLRDNQYKRGVYLKRINLIHSDCRDCRWKGELSSEEETKLKHKLYAHHILYPRLSASDLSIWVKNEFHITREPHHIRNWIESMERENTPDFLQSKDHETNIEKMLSFLKKSGYITVTTMTIFTEGFTALLNIFHITCPSADGIGATKEVTLSGITLLLYVSFTLSAICSLYILGFIP